ncbi:MAG TPA: PilZ domain-containing protein [Vicinamibacterales bacterium]
MSTVLIGADDRLAGIRARLAGGELQTFSERDALAAFDAILRERPATVALERTFAETSRGRALVDRIKADPSLADVQLRIITEDAAAGQAVASPPSPPEAAPAAGADTAPLDGRGTRRTPRVRIKPGMDVLVDGSPVALVDLSTTGAQVVSPMILRPNQRVRVILPNAGGGLRLPAVIAWASYELPRQAAPRYRAGLQFEAADPASVQAFCHEHQA